MSQGSTHGVPIDTDSTLAANSDLVVSSQKAIKTYVGNFTPTSASYAISASFAQTASYVTTSQTASYVITAQTASYITTSQTASFVTGSKVFGPLGANSVTSASYSVSSSYASTSNISTSNNTGSIILTIDGGGGVITTGQKNYSKLNYAGSIVSWNVMCTPTGSLTFDVWLTSSQTVYPTVSNTIVDANKPSISSAFITSSTNITNWTASFSSNSIVGFNVDSASLATWARLELITLKT
jgi:hypothetical protein